MGQAPPGGDCNKEGRGMVFVKAGEFDERFPVICEWTTRPLKLAHAGDVLVCVVGATAGKINEAIDCAIGRSVAAVRPKKELSTGFLYHFLSTQVQFLRAKSQGLAQGVITREMLQHMEIPLPPLTEQQQIVEVLDRSDALRARRRAAFAELESLAQSLFLELFGNPATNPKGWPIREIRDLLESASYGTSEKSSPVGEFPVLRMNNITRTGGMDFTELKFMDLDASDWERYLVRTGDVLFNRTNSAELVGKSAIFRETKKMAYAGYLVRLRVNSNNDPEYLSAFLNTSYAKRMLRGMCKSIIGMANINATEIQGMKIPSTPLPLQREFARQIRTVETLKTLQRTSLAELDALFAALQYRAFQGEL